MLMFTLFHASSHKWNKRNKHERKHEKKKDVCFSCAYAYLTSVNPALSVLPKNTTQCPPSGLPQAATGLRRAH